MSDRAIICTTDGPDKGCTIWDHDQHVDARHSLEQDPDGWGSEYGDAALDEIERLRAESARRMVWLENEQHSHEQTRLALIDMTERAAHPEITDDMVERLAKHQNDAHLTTWGFPWRRLSEEDKKAARAEARWALEAALTPKENEA